MKVRDDAVHIPLAVKFTDPGGDAEILLDFPDHEGCIIHHDCYPGVRNQDWKFHLKCSVFVYNVVVFVFR